MKAWKKSIVSLAVALCLLAGLIPVPANVAAAADETTIKYDFALTVNMSQISTTTGDCRVFDSSKAGANYTANGAWSLNNEHHSFVASYDSSVDYVNNTMLRFQGMGIQIQTTGVNQWVTFRIQVPNPGWYSPDFEIWTIDKLDSPRGSIFRAYIAPVSFAAGSITDATELATELEKLRADEYSIGLVDCEGYTSDKDAEGNRYVSQQMRTMYFPTAGEYAFTIVTEKANTYYVESKSKDVASNWDMFPRSLTLTKVADVDADADTAKAAIGDLNFSLETILGETKSFDADIATEISVDASASSLGDDANNILRSADKVTFESDNLVATYADSKISITGDTKADNTSLKVIIERDGITWDSTAAGLTVTSNSAEARTINYYFYDTATRDLLNNPAEGKTEWSSNKEYYGSVTQISKQSCGLQIACGKDSWFTVRIKVDRPGWYTPTFTTWDRNTSGIIRAYISEVDDTTPLTERGTVYCTDANSIGTLDGWNEASSDIIYHSKVMRSVYFDKAGEYAFTIKSVGTSGSSYNMRPSSLVLNRIGLRTAAAAEVLPGMTDIVPATTATVAAGASTALDIKPVMEDEAESVAGVAKENNAYEDLVSAKSVVATVAGSNAEATVSDDRTTLTIKGVTAGDATVTLTVTDAYGVVSTDTVAVTVTEPAVTCFGNTYAYIVGNKAPDGTTKYSLYIFGGIDSENYKKVGFKVNGTAAEGTTTVYEEVTVNYNTNESTTLTAKNFGLTTSGYVFCHVQDVSGITSNTDITISAYAVDANDETIDGDAVTITIVAPTAN